MSNPENPREPDPAKMGNWRSMFEARGSSPNAAAPEAAAAYDDAELHETATGEYRPWTLQRGSGRASMMIDFRRYDPRLGAWNGYSIAYPYLVSLDYTGDKLLGLDFGKVQVVIEGKGLDELARYLQQGTVLGIQEFSSDLWRNVSPDTLVSAIRRVNAGEM